MKNYKKLFLIITFLIVSICFLGINISSVKATTGGENILEKNLKYGDRGEEVKTLQRMLKKDPVIYPEGLVTGYFGPLTKKAVIHFQERYALDILAPWGLTKANGFVDEITRQKLNLLFAKVTLEKEGQVLNVADPDKPHMVREFSIPIPEDFNRINQHTFILIENTHCEERKLRFTTKDIYPGQDFNFKIGGLSPDTDYEFRVIVSSEGFHIVDEVVAFRTESAPIGEVKRVLMVIDEDLNDSELEYYYTQYEEDLKVIDSDIEVEHYYIADDFESKKELYDYLIDAYFNENIYYIFFIGKNATMSIYIYLMDLNGTATHRYFYQSLSFYTNVLNNQFEYDETEERYIAKRYLNCPAINPELQTRLISDRIPEISFGAVIPTKSIFSERKRQIINYFTKLHNFRMGEFSFDHKILYSDTMYGNDYLVDDISKISRWEDNIALDTTHEPSSGYHGDDPGWRSAYLDALVNQSFEVVWLHVHGATTFHYFGINYEDINSLPALNTCFIDLHACNTGNFRIENYIAGTYLMKDKVLAVEANMEPTFYVGYGTNDFLEHYSFNEIAKGKRFGDAIRQNGTTFATHVFFGDPFLSLDDFAIIEGDNNWCNGADIDRNGKVDFKDYSTFSNNYGRSDCSIDNDWCDRADMDRNAKVGFKDYSTLANNYGRTDCRGEHEGEGVLSVITLDSPIGKPVARGIDDFVWATALLDASASEEDIQVTSITISDSLEGDAVYADIDNAEIWADLTNGDSDRGDIYETKISNTEQWSTADQTFILNQTLIIPEGTFKKIALVADLSVIASEGSHTFRFSQVTAKNSSTGETITPTYSGSGQEMTVVDKGSLTVTTAPSSPASDIVIGGEIATLGIFRLNANNVEDLDLDHIALNIDLEDMVSSDYYINTLYFYNGDTLLGSTVPPIDIIYFDDNTLAIPAGGYKDITIKADLKPVNRVTVLNNETIQVSMGADVDCTGWVSGAAVDSFTDVSADQMYIFESRPYFSLNSNSPSEDLFPSSITLLAIFNVRADNGEDISFENADSNQIRVKVNGYVADIANPQVIFTLKDQNGATLDIADVDSMSAGTINTVIYFRFETNSFYIPAGQTKQLYVYGNTANFEDDGDSIQLSLEDDNPLNIAWGIDKAWSYNHADIIFRGDIYAGELVNPEKAEIGNNWCNGADINRDGMVSFKDFSTLANNYNRTDCSESNSWCDRIDINQDGKVDSIDNGILSNNYARTDCSGSELGSVKRLEKINNQLASISNAISNILEKIKQLISR